MALATRNPITTADQPGKKMPQASPLTGQMQRTIRVLILDDDPDGLIIFRSLLLKGALATFDAQVDTMNVTHQSAIPEIITRMEKQEFDLVISDLNWLNPHSNEGFTLLTAWKTLPEPRPGLIIWSAKLPNTDELPSIGGFERVMIAKKPNNPAETMAFSKIIEECAKC